MALAELSSCISVVLRDTYIVLSNRCGSEVYVARVEVAYTITGFLPEPLQREEQKQKRVRRRVEERIRVNYVLKPGEEKQIYFGPTENIEELWVVAGFSRDDLRKVKLPAGRA